MPNQYNILPPASILLDQIRSGLLASQVAAQYNVTRWAVGHHLKSIKPAYLKARQSIARDRIQKALDSASHEALADAISYSYAYCPRLYSSKWLVKALIRYTKLHPTWKVEAKTARRARIAAREQAKLAKPG